MTFTNSQIGSILQAGQKLLSLKEHLPLSQSKKNKIEEQRQRQEAFTQRRSEGKSDEDEDLADFVEKEHVLQGQQAKRLKASQGLWTVDLAQMVRSTLDENKGVGVSLREQVGDLESMIQEQRQDMHNLRSDMQ